MQKDGQRKWDENEYTDDKKKCSYTSRLSNGLRKFIWGMVWKLMNSKPREMTVLLLQTGKEVIQYYMIEKMISSFSPAEDTEKERTSTTLSEHTRCGVINTVHRPNVHSFQGQMESSFRLYCMLRQRTNPRKLWAVIRSKLCCHK